MNTDADTIYDLKPMLIPFVFYSDAFELAGAINLTKRGFLQRQVTSNLVGLVGSNKSVFSHGEINNLQIPYINRVFMNLELNAGNLRNLSFYYGSNPDFNGQWAGTNSSGKNNNFQTHSQRLDFTTTFKYLLPIGNAKNKSIKTVVLDEGLPASLSIQQKIMEPEISLKNRTFLTASLFYNYQNAEIEEKPDYEAKVTGYSLGLLHENVDFSENPSSGIKYNFSYKKGADILPNSTPWETIESSFSKYFAIAWGDARQKVLALNIWTSHTFSWNHTSMQNGNLVYHRPMPSKGSSLGGEIRLRGYPDARFFNKSALYYGLEYRVVPDFNPFKNSKLMQKFQLDVDWLQVVTFFEAGRVAPEWNLTTFHKQMKYDAGLGVRMFVNNMVIRVDSGVSPEGVQLQMYIKQAF